jgi:hypothetical protein
MPSAKGNSVNHPEKKFGPVGSGVSVAVWLNTIETDGGERKVRSITISPRRYFDPEKDEWRDASSYRPTDIPPLVYSLQKALEYIYTTPIAGQKPDDEESRGGGSF